MGNYVACLCLPLCHKGIISKYSSAFLPSFLLLPGGEVMCVLPSSSLRSANRFWSAIDQVCVRRSVIRRTHFCRRRRRKRMWRFSSSRGANLGSPPKKVNVLGISVIALAGSNRLQEIGSVRLSDSFCNSARPETDAY